jgi:stearoyl-CoA desaturase (delta-9 desaturase)
MSLDPDTAVRPGPRLSWRNILVIAAVHACGAAAVVHAVGNFSWWTVGLALLWLLLCSLSISGGYHRLFSHPTYRAAWPVRLFYVLFGAASVQNAALKWAADHRIHHAKTDHDGDPYNARRGFWWSHLFWNFFQDDEPVDMTRVDDLQRDPLVRFQTRFYVPLALVMGVLLPAAIGLIWGDPIGALLVAGALRIAVQWHLTWSINSVAHAVGTQPYSRSTTARDSWLTAIVTFGEGYHNYHHRFPNDYRNGVRWHHFDPTKWFVWALSKVGLTWDLRRMSDLAITRARDVASRQETLGARAR